MSRPSYFEVNGHQYHSVRQLLARGWSLALINDELGGPDVVQETAFGDRKLFLKYRTDVAERDSFEVCQMLAKYWQAKAHDAQHRAKVLARRRNNFRRRNRHRGNDVQPASCELDEIDYG